MERNLQQESDLMALRINNVIQSTLLSCFATLSLIVNMTHLIRIAKKQNMETDEQEMEVNYHDFDKQKRNLEKLIRRIWESIPSRNIPGYIDYCRAVHQAGQPAKNPPLPELRRDIVPDRHEVLLQTL